MTYTARDLDQFLAKLPPGPSWKRDVLCQSRKGRDVPLLHVGRLDGKPDHRIWISARHHACEMMASYTVEGLIQGILVDDATGQWLREHVEFLVTPIVDFDGVEDGEQGEKPQAARPQS